MIVKFLSNKSGGGTGSVNYLLNQERVQDGTARILKGDEQITRQLIESITKKQKTTFGVMSFEEANIPEAQKYELMDQFERTFCAGLNKEQFNILWVEHTDKGRLELNCIIPKVELSTGKAFNPYNHGSDLHIKDLFTKSINLKYGFSDPQDPAKTASVSGSKKEIRLFQDYEKLDQQLKTLVAQGAIQDRSEMIDLLKQNGIDVTRTGADYISVKLPESKKARRLNGGIYNEQFTSVDELRDVREIQVERERAFTGRDSQKEYGAVAQRLSTALTKRAEYNAELYREPPKRKRATQERITERARELKIVSERDDRSGQQRPIEAQTVGIKKPMGHNQGEINDGIRSAVARYARAREERSRARETRSSERTQRTSLYASINQQATATDHRAIGEAYGQRKHRGHIIQAISRLSDKFDSIINGITQQVDKLVERIAELRQPKRETEIELFVKSRPNDGTIKEALFKLEEFNKGATPTRSPNLSR